jgi:hypothetical protein
LGFGTGTKASALTYNKIFNAVIICVVESHNGVGTKTSALVICYILFFTPNRDVKPVPNLLRTVQQLFDLHSDENLQRKAVKTINMLLLQPIRDETVVASLEELLAIKKDLKKTNIFEGANCKDEEVRSSMCTYL